MELFTVPPTHWHRLDDVWLELTTLLIPRLNDSDAEIDAMSRWVVDHPGLDVPMHFTAAHRLPDAGCGCG